MLPKTVLTYLVLQSHFANQQLQNMSEKEKSELREKFSSLAKGQKNWKQDWRTVDFPKKEQTNLFC